MIDRYMDSRIETIWGDQIKWELATTYEMAMLATITKSDDHINEHAIIGLCHGLLDNSDYTNKLVERIHIEEQRTEHDVMAFINVLDLALMGKLPDHIRNLLHWGATSSDVVDSVQEIQSAYSTWVVACELDNLIHILENKIIQYAGQPMSGRTHGVHGAYITLTHKLFKYYYLLKKIAGAFDGQEFYFKASGPMGCHEFITRDMEKQAKDTFMKLALGRKYDVSIHYPFEVWQATDQILPRMIQYGRSTMLAGLSSILAQLAMEIRHLHRTEVAEILEARPSASSGSSAMPHKKNPITCERICGMHRLMKSYTMVTLDNTQLWHERDISHSSTERVIIEDSYHTILHMLTSMTKVIKTIDVDTERIQDNIETYHIQAGHWSYYMLNLLTKRGFGREEVYEFIKNDFPLDIEKCGGLWLAMVDSAYLRERFATQGLDLNEFVAEMREYMVEYTALFRDEAAILEVLK